MRNPWNDVPLEIYESHMSLSDVAQLQALNDIMREQVKAACPGAESAAVVGVAGGNGLEHCLKRFKLVYGIDVNPDYLKICAQRFGPAVDKKLRLMEIDLSRHEAALPKVDMIIADLLIEYVGTDIFCEKAVTAQAQYVSCVIQGSDNGQSFVSESPYQAAFQSIGKLHQDVDEAELTKLMAQCGYNLVYREISDMPNGKRLIRLDYESEADRQKIQAIIQNEDFV